MQVDCQHCGDERLEALTPLEVYRQEFNYTPYHFWQLADAMRMPVQSHCNGLVYERAMTGTAISGREELRRSIADAERVLENILGFPPVVRPVCDEITFPGGLYSPYTGHGIQLSRARVREIGRWAWVDVDIVDTILSDENGDGVIDTFTLTTPNSAGITQQDIRDGNIQVWWPDDAWPLSRSEEVYHRRIHPTYTRVLDNGELEVKGPAWVIVRPKLLDDFYVPVVQEPQTLNFMALDPTETATFASELLIRRRYVDTEGAVRVRWHHADGCASSSFSQWGLTNATSNGCYACADGSACIRNHRNGIIDVTPTWPGTGSSGLCTCRRARIDGLTVEYIAGEENYQREISILAGVDMGRDLCDCLNARLAQLSEDQQVFERGAGVDIINKKVQDNPLGTTLGHEQVWRRIRRRRRRRAISL